MFEQLPNEYRSECRPEGAFKRKNNGTETDKIRKKKILNNREKECGLYHWDIRKKNKVNRAYVPWATGTGEEIRIRNDTREQFGK